MKKSKKYRIDSSYMVEYLSEERLKTLKINEDTKVRWFKLKNGDDIKFLSLRNVIREINNELKE